MPKYKLGRSLELAKVLGYRNPWSYIAPPNGVPLFENILITEGLLIREIAEFVSCRTIPKFDIDF